MASRSFNDWLKGSIGEEEIPVWVRESRQEERVEILKKAVQNGTGRLFLLLRRLQTPVHPADLTLAVQYGHGKIVEYLLDAGIPAERSHLTTAIGRRDVDVAISLWERRRGLDPVLDVIKEASTSPEPEMVAWGMALLGEEEPADWIRVAATVLEENPPNLAVMLRMDARWTTVFKTHIASLGVEDILVRAVRRQRVDTVNAIAHLCAETRTILGPELVAAWRRFDASLQEDSIGRGLVALNPEAAFVRSVSTSQEPAALPTASIVEGANFVRCAIWGGRLPPRGRYAPISIPDRTVQLLREAVFTGAIPIGRAFCLLTRAISPLPAWVEEHERLLVHMMGTPPSTGPNAETNWGDLPFDIIREIFLRCGWTNTL